MCAASLLYHPLSCPAVMPGGPQGVHIDAVMMRLYISQSPPCSFLGPSSSPSSSSPHWLHCSAHQRAGPRRLSLPCVRPPGSASGPGPAHLSCRRPSCLRGGGASGEGGGATKEHRRVSFADAKGLSLTAVHVFSRFQDDPLALPPRSPASSSLCCDDLQFDLLDLDDDHTTRPSGGGRRPRLALDFAQPSCDYLAFRSRLQRDAVALESAALSQGEGRRGAELSGTVAVRRDVGVGCARNVALRVTFDGWRTHQDVPATFMNNVYCCVQDADTFSFAVELPPVAGDESSSAASAVQFCVRFQAEGDERCYWDNNHGHNYGLRLEPPSVLPDRTKPSPTKLLLPLPPDSNPEFDRYGSPRLSSGMFPEWQSWGHADPTVPYW